jgi:acyl-CoA synthetase (AMP-forming)/AMP-acid ligase II
MDTVTKMKQKAYELAQREDTYLTEQIVDKYINQGWPQKTYYDLLEENAAMHPSGVAIIDEDGSTTSWQELLEKSNAFAAALLDLGFKQGDCIGLQLPNWSEFCSIVLGAARIGVRPTFIHMPYRAYEMEYILGLTEAKGLVTPESYRNTSHLDLARQMQERIPSLKHIILVRSNATDNTFNFDDLLEKHKGAPISIEKPVSTELFVLMFTSGTTSRPKGVMHMHANLMSASLDYVDAFDLKPEDKWLAVTPMTHLTAFGIPFLSASLAAGSTIAFLEAWNVSKALKATEELGITHFVGAPPMLIDMARSEELIQRDLSELRFLMYAGAPCPIEILKKLQAQLGCALTVFYGWTEGLAHTYTLPDDPLEITSVTVGRTGKPFETKIVDDAGNEVGFGEVGEFWGRGPNLSPGYYRQPQFTKERYNQDGWFMSGDLVTKNPDGTYTFVARKDDVINRGGQKIDPREVEEILYTHPKISQVVVVAVPDERLGEKACACVVPAQGQTITLDEIKAFLEEKGLAKYKWPEYLDIIDALPMTPTGKIMRYALREKLRTLAAK